MKILILLTILLSSLGHAASDTAKISKADISEEPVYKILRQSEWGEFNINGIFHGSSDDIRDGFIHLATISQVERIIKKYFPSERPIFVVKFSDIGFLSKLVWEASSSGGIYPHLYNTPLLFRNIDSFNVIN